MALPPNPIEDAVVRATAGIRGAVTEILSDATWHRGQPDPDAPGPGTLFDQQLVQIEVKDVLFGEFHATGLRALKPPSYGRLASDPTDIRTFLIAPTSANDADVVLLSGIGYTTEYSPEEILAALSRVQARRGQLIRRLLRRWRT